MKILFLDRDYFQKPHENLDYSAWTALGEYSYFNMTEENDILDRAADADVILVLKIALPSTIIAQLKKTKLICKVGTGCDRIAVKTANAHGITVTNFPGYAANIVAQWTISLMLTLAGNILLYDRAVRRNEWLAAQFTYPITDITHKTLGIMGYGHIGKAVARMATGLGMRVLVSTNHPDNNSHVEFVNPDYIYTHADFISLNGSLTENTIGMINDAVFKRMKPSSYVINTSRADFIDKEALYHALTNNIIAGAALDGFWQEPPEPDEPLLKLDNIIITPHIGWVARETRQLLINHIGERIKKFFAGEIIHTVT